MMCRQSEEDVGSAGEQPASNKVDAHTIERQSLTGCLFYFIGKLYD